MNRQQKRQSKKLELSRRKQYEKYDKMPIPKLIQNIFATIYFLDMVYILVGALFKKEVTTGTVVVFVSLLGVNIVYNVVYLAIYLHRKKKK